MFLKKGKLSRCNKLLLAIILLASGLVRLWGINFGLPYLYNPDEGKLVYTTFYAASNWLKPDIYIHSVLVSYLLLPFLAFYYLIGKILGIFSSPFDFYVAYLSNPTNLVMIGRTLLVVASLACVWMVWCLGKRYFGERSGIIGAFFLGFCFLFVKESHYIKDEVLASFFLLIFFNFLLQFYSKNGKRQMLLASLFLGLAISVKHIYLPVLFVFWGVVTVKRGLSKILLVSTIVTLVFLLTNPYTIIDLRQFFLQTMNFFLHQRTIGVAHLAGRSAWQNFLVEHLPNGMGWPLFLVAVLGVIFSFFSHRKQTVLLALMVISIFAGIILGGGTFPRWAVPLLPFLCLAGGVFLAELIRNKILLAVVSMLVIVPSFVRTVKFDQVVTWPDTRTLSKEWIEEANIPLDATMAVEGMARDEIPSYLGPPLRLSLEKLQERLERVKKRNQAGNNLLAQVAAGKDKIGFDLKGVMQLNFPFDYEKESNYEAENVNFYTKNRVDYLVSSSWAAREGMSPKQKFVDSLSEEYELIKVFEPTIPFLNEPHAWRVDYAGLDKVPILGKGIFGPTIKIYRLK